MRSIRMKRGSGSRMREPRVRRIVEPLILGDKSYAQCAKYLDSLGLLEGWMPIFEKSREKSWDEKIYSRDEVVDGKTIHVIGL